MFFIHEILLRKVLSWGLQIWKQISELIDRASFLSHAICFNIPIGLMNLMCGLQLIAVLAAAVLSRVVCHGNDLGGYVSASY